MENVNVLRVLMSSLDCPHCQQSQDGWLIDPRGTNQTCDECGKTYHVPKDVRLEF